MEFCPPMLNPNHKGHHFQEVQEGQDNSELRKSKFQLFENISMLFDRNENVF